VNVINEIYQKTGVYDKYTLTSICLLDSESTSLMFKLDEITFENNIDSLADQIINFNSEDSRLTQKYVP